MSGIILAGGNNSRFGENKALVRLGELSLIENIISVLQPIFPEIIIVASPPDDYRHLGFKVIEDIIPRQGPLSGIHAGLAHSSSFYNFIVACDMPFLNSGLIRFMREKLSGSDILLPRVGGKVEPLHAFYAKSCLEYIERRLNSQRLRLTELLHDVHTEYIEAEEISAFDPRGRSFVNINTPEDYETIKSREKTGAVAGC